MCSSARWSCSAAVAALRAEDVAGEALAVDAHQHRLVGAEGSPGVHQRQVLLAGDAGSGSRGPAARRRASAAAARRRARRAARAQPVADQVRDRDHRAGRAARAKRASSGTRAIDAVLVHDLADDAGGRQAGERGEVDRGLGLARRASTPPRRARSGKTWPGRCRSSGRVAGSTAVRMVAARSAAEMPVVTLPRASMETVKAVP